MRIVKILFIGHLAALLFGLGGLLIALPHPELWDTSPSAVQVFNFGIRYAGSLHILFGAATMLLFGLLFVGRKKTLIFVVAATTISLSMELMGTGTGFPFGPYSYTDFLGIKVAGLVPYSIPLSWFYMGFASYLLANGIVDRLGLRWRTVWSLLLGAYFLTAWDLALDPAMASQYLPIHFWIWHESGPYFGMPIRNLVGWSITGLIYMSVSRLFWRANLDPRRIAVWVPFGVYTANIAFAIALNLSVGLWLPPIMAILFGFLPSLLVFFLRPGTGTKPLTGNKHKNLIAQYMTLLTLRTGSRAIMRRRMQVQVEGLENLPPSGPLVIAARHFHHLYDGCVLIGTVPRPLHILVALDWVQHPWLRVLMEWACNMANWPIVLRSERLNESTEKSSYSSQESMRYLRHALKDSVQLLRNGDALLVFPEAYPNIDPTFTPKQDTHAFLPFRSGFSRVVEMAERDGQTSVAIVPAGLTYTQNAEDKRNERWLVTLRFGPPLYRRDYVDSRQLVQAIEEQVHALSGETVRDAQAKVYSESSRIS